MFHMAEDCHKLSIIEEEIKITGLWRGHFDVEL